jgi:hypothetical protein
MKPKPRNWEEILALVRQYPPENLFWCGTNTGCDCTGCIAKGARVAPCVYEVLSEEQWEVYKNYRTRYFRDLAPVYLRSKRGRVLLDTRFVVFRIKKAKFTACWISGEESGSKIMLHPVEYLSIGEPLILKIAQACFPDLNLTTNNYEELEFLPIDRNNYFLRAVQENKV